jgi:hypothetical protein
VPSLLAEIDRRFRGRAPTVLRHLQSVALAPKKGKTVGVVGGVLIKELKYEGWRFYFLTDGHRVTFYDPSELTDLLLLFIRMSDKKTQQATIEEIKNVLRTIGPSGFS